MEAIRGDVITNERRARGDVLMTESERGGVTFQTLSYFDVLLDNGTITKPQAEYGKKYWGLREIASASQNTKTAKLDYVSDHEEDEFVPSEDEAEEGMGEAVYLEIIRALKKPDYTLLNACCTMLDENDMTNRMAIFWAFGEIAILHAFNNLERLFPICEENAKVRIKNINSPLQSYSNVVDLGLGSHAQNPRYEPAT